MKESFLIPGLWPKLSHLREDTLKEKGQSCLQEYIPVPSSLIPRCHKCSSEEKERTFPSAIRIVVLPGPKRSGASKEECG